MADHRFSIGGMMALSLGLGSPTTVAKAHGNFGSSNNLMGDATLTNALYASYPRGKIEVLHLSDAFIRRCVPCDEDLMLLVEAQIESCVANELRRGGIVGAASASANSSDPLHAPKIVEHVIYYRTTDEYKSREMLLTAEPFDMVVHENVPQQQQQYTYSSSSFSSTDSSSLSQGQSLVAVGPYELEIEDGFFTRMYTMKLLNGGSGGAGGPTSPSGLPVDSTTNAFPASPRRQGGPCITTVTRKWWTSIYIRLDSKTLYRTMKKKRLSKIALRYDLLVPVPKKSSYAVSTAPGALSDHSSPLSARVVSPRTARKSLRATRGKSYALYAVVIERDLLPEYKLVASVEIPLFELLSAKKYKAAMSKIMLSPGVASITGSGGAGAGVSGSAYCFAPIPTELNKSCVTYASTLVLYHYKMEHYDYMSKEMDLMKKKFYARINRLMTNLRELEEREYAHQKDRNDIYDEYNKRLYALETENVKLKQSTTMLEDELKRALSAARHQMQSVATAPPPQLVAARPIDQDSSFMSAAAPYRNSSLSELPVDSFGDLEHQLVEQYESRIMELEKLSLEQAVVVESQAAYIVELRYMLLAFTGYYRETNDLLRSLSVLESQLDHTAAAAASVVNASPRSSRSHSPLVLQSPPISGRGHGSRSGSIISNASPRMSLSLASLPQRNSIRLGLSAVELGILYARLQGQSPRASASMPQIALPAIVAAQAEQQAEQQPLPAAVHADIPQIPIPIPTPRLKEIVEESKSFRRKSLQYVANVVSERRKIFEEQAKVAGGSTSPHGTPLQRRDSGTDAQGALTKRSPFRSSFIAQNPGAVTSPAGSPSTGASHILK